MHPSSQSDGDTTKKSEISLSQKIFLSLLSRSTDNRYRKKKQSQRQISFDAGSTSDQRRKSNKKRTKYHSLRSMLYGLNLKQEKEEAERMKLLKRERGKSLLKKFI
ncbi:hypothetical protein ACH3XW_22060 [Acanthocheilonema viteae]